MAGRNRRSLLVAGGVVLWGVATGLLALMGHVEAALAAVAVSVAFLSITSITLFLRVSNGLRMLKSLDVPPMSGPGSAGGRRGLALDGTLRLEASERRLLAVVETERLRSEERHAELLDRLERGQTVSDAVGSSVTTGLDAVRRTVREVRESGWEETRSVEALLQLMQGTRLRAPMPPSGKYALEARGLLELRELIEKRAPKVVLEIGSGTSTIWMGYLLESIGARIVSLDHEESYGRITAWNVDRHQLAETVDLRVAPLVPWRGEDRLWYDETLIDDLERVDFVVVDGPPNSTGEHARYPALPVVAGRLSEGAIIVLDDTHRRSERETVDRWLAEFPKLVRVIGEYGRMTVLRWGETITESHSS